jgi:hypothetical protein
MVSGDGDPSNSKRIEWRPKGCGRGTAAARGRPWPTSRMIEEAGEVTAIAPGPPLAFIAGALKLTTPLSQFVIFHFGGALNERADDDGAVGKRDAGTSPGSRAHGPRVCPPTPNVAWVRGAWESIRPFNRRELHQLPTGRGRHRSDRCGLWAQRSAPPAPQGQVRSRERVPSEPQHLSGTVTIHWVSAGSARGAGLRPSLRPNGPERGRM